MSATPISFVPVLIGFTLHIAGCTAPLSPEAQCFAEATVKYRAAWRTAEAARADLDRGYALHDVTVDRAAAVPCRVDGVRSTCLHEAHETLTVPAPIDRPALERRLAASEAQMEALRPAAMRKAASCGYGEVLAQSDLAPVRP